MLLDSTLGPRSALQGWARLRRRLERAPQLVEEDRRDNGGTGRGDDLFGPFGGCVEYEGAHRLVLEFSGVADATLAFRVGAEFNS